MPENIRKSKWQKVQESRPQFAELFGQNYVEFDNSEDLRKASPDVVKQKKEEMTQIFKFVSGFIEQQPKSDTSSKWIARELESKDTTSNLKKLPDTGKHPHPESKAKDEAGRLVLEYYGFGRYGTNGEVTYRVVGDTLVPVVSKNMQPKQEKAKSVNESFENFLNEEVSFTIKGDTPEELAKALSMIKTGVQETDDEDDEDEVEEHYSLSSTDAKTLLTFNRQLNEDLRKWFDPNHPKGGWKRIDSKGNVKGDCAREPGESKPKCMSNEKRSKLSKKERANAVKVKRKHDPVADRKGKGGKPVNVSNFGKGKISESIDKGTEVGMSMASSGENLLRGNKQSVAVKKKPFESFTADAGTESMAAQKVGELKRQGIDLKTFRAKRPIG